MTKQSIRELEAVFGEMELSLHYADCTCEGINECSYEGYKRVKLTSSTIRFPAPKKPVTVDCMGVWSSRFNCIIFKMEFTTTLSEKSHIEVFIPKNFRLTHLNPT